MVLLVVTAGCTAAFANASPAGDANTNSDVSQAASGSTVTVGASGSVEAEPEQAVVRVSIRAEADQARDVREQMAERAERMRAALEGMDLEVDVVSADYDIRADRERRPEGDAATRFVGRHSFVLTVDAPDRAGDLVVTAVENGASTVDGVRFTVTEETRRQLREQALDRAMQNARAEADVLADRGGLELTTVASASTGSVQVTPYRAEFAVADGGDAGGVPTSFDTGTVTVSAQVQVTYDAEA